VLEITLPPLRQRPEDLPILIEEILERAGASGPGVATLRAPEVIAELQQHAWPGNVRELRNYVERCVAFDEAPVLATAPAPAGSAVDPTKPLRVERERWVRELEREYLEKLLAAHGGNVSAAARAAEIDRVHMYRLLWRTGLRTSES
jgi:DNA-binding NtrC family response regulator